MESRRIGLDAYLRELLCIPATHDDLNFLRFLGLVPGGEHRPLFSVPGLPHTMLIELRQALISYQDYHMLLLTLAGLRLPHHPEVHQRLRLHGGRGLGPSKPKPRLGLCQRPLLTPSAHA